MDEGDVVQLLFQHHADGPVTGGAHGQDIKHALVVGVEHTPALLGDVLLAGDGELNVAAGEGVLHDVLNVAVHLGVGILLGGLGVPAQLHPGAGNKAEIVQDHGHNAVHSVSPCCSAASTGVIRGFPKTAEKRWHLTSNA